MRRVLVVFLAFVVSVGAFAQQPLTFSKLVLFGDNYSDTLNVYQALYPIMVGTGYGDYYTTTHLAYPGPDSGYELGAFTNSRYISNANPWFTKYEGTWHEQLHGLLPGVPLASTTYLGLPVATPSTNFAWGSATTQNTTSNVPFAGYTTVVPNMGKQIDNYLNAGNIPDSTSLFVVFGGLNDLLADSSQASATAAAQRVTALVQRLIDNGAVHVLVPNVPGISANPNAPIDVAAAQFKTALAADLGALRASYNLRGVPNDIIMLDLQQLYANIMAAPAQYGFTNVKDKAQPNNSLANTYLNWDGVNPTTTGHFQIADAACTALTRTVTTLMISNAISTPSQLATLTALVSTAGTYGEQASGMPTGIVTFYYPQTVLSETSNVVIGTASIDATGHASLPITNLLTGTHTIYATYSGDTNFAPGCRSNEVDMTSAADPGFYVNFDPTADYIGIGNTVYANVQAIGVGGFTGTVTFSCGTPMPADFTCSFPNPNSTYRSDNWAPAQLVVHTGTLTWTTSSTYEQESGGITFAFLLGAVPLAVFMRRRRGRKMLANTCVLTVCAALCVLFSSVGCGGIPKASGGLNPEGGNNGGSTGGSSGHYVCTSCAAPGSYTVPIVATYNGVQTKLDYHVYIANTITPPY